MASIAPQSITLKTGQAAVIRCPAEADAAALMELIASNLANSTGMVRRPDEYTLTLAQQGEWIVKHRDDPAWIVLLCEVEGKLVACLGFENQQRKRISHGGSFGMGVHYQWRGRGIGEALLHVLLGWAAVHPQIEKVSLSVLADNAPAIALYHKLGFSEEGRRFREIKRDDGQYVDDILMYRWVK